MTFLEVPTFVQYNDQKDNMTWCTHKSMDIPTPIKQYRYHRYIYIVTLYNVFFHLGQSHPTGPKSPQFMVISYSGDSVSDRLTKRTIPEYRPPFYSPKYFPIHIMYRQIQKANRPAIRDTDHPFSVPNHKRTRKTDQPKIIIHIFTVLYICIN